jgi:YVTN family beta-propeller protein
MAFSPDGKYLYLTDAAQVQVISTATNKVIATIGGFANARDIAVNPTNGSVYVAETSTGTVSVF